MSKYKLKKIISQTFSLENNNHDYYENVLVSLGLSKFYIRYNNYFYFGTNDITDQVTIKLKFENLQNVYDSFLDKVYKKYSNETLILEFGIIYTKLQKIHLCNDEVLELGINDNEKEKDISYPAKLADLMARKIKTLTEIAIIKNNNKFDFGFSNSDYKKFIILL